MKIRTLAVAMGLTVALAAATAGTSTAHMAAPKKSAHQTVHKVYTAPFGTVAIRTGNYIYLPGFAPNPNAQPAMTGLYVGREQLHARRALRALGRVLTGG